jgi:hypothetical protein
MSAAAAAALNLAALVILEPVHVGAGHYAPGDEAALAPVLDRKTAEDLVAIRVLGPGVLQDPVAVAAELDRRAQIEAALAAALGAEQAAAAEETPAEG